MNWVNLMVLSITCFFTVLWYHSGFFQKRQKIRIQLFLQKVLNSMNFVEISERHSAEKSNDIVAAIVKVVSTSGNITFSCQI